MDQGIPILPSLKQEKVWNNLDLENYHFEDRLIWWETDNWYIAVRCTEKKKTNHSTLQNIINKKIHGLLQDLKKLTTLAFNWLT